MKTLINLERLKAKLANDFGVTIKAIDAYLQKVVFNQEVKELNQREIRQILSNADGEIKGLFRVYIQGLKDNWRGLYAHRSQSLHTTFKRSLSEPKRLLAYADKVMAKPLNLSANTGISLDEILAKFSQDESDRIIRAIRLAHSEGLTNDKLVQMIRGSKARRYQDGILNISTRHARVIAHTGTAVINSHAKQDFIAQNRDIVKAIKIMATLDLRTSPICRDKDGQIMPIDKAVFPPYHFNCRSDYELITDDYTPPKQRASMNGVVKNQSYYEWLKSQPKDEVAKVLGKQKAEIFLADGMTVDKFKQLGLDKTFMPMGLDELIGVEKRKPAYQSIHLGGLKPRHSEVIRLQNEPTKHGEKPKTPRPAEAQLADLLQQYFGIYLVRYDDRYHKASPTGNPPDFATKDNELPIKEWQTLDVMYAIDDDVDIKAYLHSITKSDKAWERQKENIINHIEKSDIVPLDLRKFDKQRLEKIIGFVLSLDEEQQNKILIIKGDDDDYDKQGQ